MVNKRHSQKPPPGENVWGTHSPIRILLSLTSSGGKVKELNLMTEDCLCVMQNLEGGHKSINQQNLQIIGGMQIESLPLFHPRFVITDFRW